MKTPSFVRKSLYSALVFFGTLLVLSAGYATWNSVMMTASSGSTLSSSNWNALVDNISDLDSRWSRNGLAIGFTGGNVGIGTTGPSQKLSIVGGQSNQLILDNLWENTTTAHWANNGTVKGQVYYDLSNDVFEVWSLSTTTRLGFVTNTHERMSITSSGNVGIGIISPTEKLDVAGTVKATNFSGLAGSFTTILATATVGNANPTTWTANAVCPAGYTIVFWGAQQSVQYWGGGMTHWYGTCISNGNGVRAELYTDKGYTGHHFSCMGLCAK